MDKANGDSFVAKPREWTTPGLLDQFMRVNGTMEDRAFAFVLGAGASVTSNIPGAATLVRKWIEELHRCYIEDGTQSSLDAWATPANLGIDGFTLANAAAFYPQVYDKRFGDDPESGYAYLEDIMKLAEPSIGYSILAKVLETTRHKVVITTNFDNLVADALSIYTDTFPLICGHESLTGFVRSRLRRPLIAKIHRDLLYAPKNDIDGTSRLDEGWARCLRTLLRDYTPIFIGYGGNDGSLMGFLERMGAGEIQGGIYWCYYRAGGRPSDRVQGLVTKHNGKLVPILGFDEFMLQLEARLGFKRLDDEIERRAQDRVRVYRDQRERIQERLAQPSSDTSQKDALKPVQEALAATADQEEFWWYWQLKAAAERNPDKAESIYRKGLERFPNHPKLVANFAIFMEDVRRSYDAAERLYRQALELDPNDAGTTGNLALFLETQRENYDEAERLYRRALELDPNYARVTANFAIFMETERENYDEAERLFRRALELNPNDASITANFATFMETERENYDEAERLYRRALELDPTDARITADFADFIEKKRENYNEAERLYRRALELDPGDADITNNFAVFMETERENYDEAERLYRRALELDPNGAGIAAAFADFMEKKRRNYDEAERLYRRALELDPDDADITNNFAVFMETERENYDEAERLYRRALELGPNDARIAADFAGFMEKKRRNYDEAERLYRRALELDPDDADITNNFAVFMTDPRKKHDEAETFFRRSLELDPDDAETISNFAVLLFIRKRLLEAKQQIRKALMLDKHQPCAALLCWCLIAQAEKRDDSPGLGRLKLVLEKGIPSASWYFAEELRVAGEMLSAEEMPFYVAITNAIADNRKLKDLEQFDRWRHITPIPPDAPWDADQLQ